MVFWRFRRIKDSDLGNGGNHYGETQRAGAGRGLDDKRWMEPAMGKFHFKLAGGKLTEVSEPED